MRAHQGSLHGARKIADLKWLPEHRGPIYEVLRYILVRVARRENHRQLRVRALLRQSPPARSCRASRSRPSASPDCRPSTRRCDVAGANGSYGSGLVPINPRVRKEESKEQTCLPRCGQALDYRLLRRKQKSLAGERQSEGFLPDASISTGFAYTANSCNRSPCASAPTPRSLNPTLWCCRVEWRCAWPSDTALDAHRNGLDGFS
jgi:hypothetical protein